MKRISQRKLYYKLKVDGIGWVSPGEVKYRAAYAANKDNAEAKNKFVLQYLFIRHIVNTNL